MTTETPPPSLTIPIAMIGAPAIFVPAGQTDAGRARHQRQPGPSRPPHPARWTNFIMLGRPSEPGELGVNPSPLEPEFRILPPTAASAPPLNLDPANQPLAPWRLLVQASPRLGWMRPANRCYLLISSKIHLTLKLSSRQAVVWAVDMTRKHPRGRPAGARPGFWRAGRPGHLHHRQ